MSVQSIPRGRYGFERQGWWATAAVLAVILAMWFIPAGIDAAVAAPVAQPVNPSITYTVTDDDAKATVTPAQGWFTSTGTSGSPLVFGTGGVTVVAQIFSDVEDIDRLWDRQDRQGQTATPVTHLNRNGTYTTPTGLSGPVGSISGGDMQGEVFLLAADGANGNVLRIDVYGTAGAQSRHLDELTAFVDTAEMEL